MVFHEDEISPKFQEMMSSHTVFRRLKKYTDDFPSILTKCTFHPPSHPFETTVPNLIVWEYDIVVFVDGCLVSRLAVIMFLAFFNSKGELNLCYFVFYTGLHLVAIFLNKNCVCNVQPYTSTAHTALNAMMVGRGTPFLFK